MHILGCILTDDSYEAIRIALMRKIDGETIWKLFQCFPQICIPPAILQEIVNTEYCTERFLDYSFTIRDSSFLYNFINHWQRKRSELDLDYEDECDFFPYFYLNHWDFEKVIEALKQVYKTDALKMPARTYYVRMPNGNSAGEIQERRFAEREREWKKTVTDI